jgi:hypothetical protein
MLFFGAMKRPAVLLLAACGVILGGRVVWQLGRRIEPNALAAQTAAPAAPAAELAALQAEVARLKAIAPSASVAMASVGAHFSGLWFAGQERNWPLAAFYFGEARQHMRWLIRITPKPKGPTGDLVDLQAIFDAVDSTVYNDVKQAIDKKDSARFPVAYRQALEACYACHKAVGRPYLRPMIPQTPMPNGINPDPNATWPR